METESLQIEIQMFVNARDWQRHHTLANLAESIVIEASELLREFQWENKNDNPLDIDRVKDELADVLIYCLSMANQLDVDVGDIILDKMEKNAIKYPL